MKRLMGSLVLIAGVGIAAVQPAAAGSSTDAALALGAFAVFNQIVRGETIFHQPQTVVRETVVVQQPPRVVAPPPVVYAPPPPLYAPAPVVVTPPTVVYRPASPVVVYPQGRWVFERSAWVWLPPHPRHAHYGRHGWRH